MTKIYIAAGEHQTCPGILMSAHKTNEGAQNRAAKLVAIMARDAGMTGPVGPTNWESVLKKLQHKYGEARCGFGVRSIKLED